jgi:ubiquinone/menaquinone biosynthesis C-methylase UbiE
MVSDDPAHHRQRRGCAKDPSTEDVLHANIVLHRAEAPFYDKIHHEIFNPIESCRTNQRLRRVSKFMQQRRGWALDFGSGTGNIAVRLSRMGFRVVAFDLSEEMLRVLRNKSKHVGSRVVVGEQLPFKEGAFSLVVSYAVVHHVLDYVGLVRSLARLLQQGGILYIDHETDSTSPLFQPRGAYRIYRQSSHYLNAVYRRIRGIEPPILDYVNADVHCNPESPLDWRKLRTAVEASELVVLEDDSYLLHLTALPNPLWPFLGLWLSDTRYIIAKRP